MRGEARVIECDFGRVAALWPGNDLVPHAHRDAHIIIPITGSGRQTLFVASELYALDLHIGYLVNPFQVHSFHAPEDDLQSSFLAFYIDPCWLSRQSNLSPHRPFARRTLKLDEQMIAQSVAFMEAISYGDQLDDMLDMELSLFLHNLLAAAQQDGADVDERTSLPRSDFRIRRAMQFMQQNLENRFTLDCVARHVGLSRPHFFSLFVQQTQLTPRMYWNVLRIERALNEIKRPRVQLGELAYDLGFSSQGNFSRFFRERTGVSPNSYRRAALR